MDIIFDLDGTLWNPTSTILKSWQETFNDYSINITATDINYISGLTNKDIINWLIVEKGVNINYAQKILTSCQKKELILIESDGGILFPNVEKTLKELSKHNNLYIVSNCQKGYIDAFLKFYDFNKYFKDFECAGNTRLNKKENLRIIIERNKIKKPVYVGDTIIDQQSAWLNNIPYIYATYGFGKVDNYVYKIDKFQDLKEVCYNLEKKGNSYGKKRFI